MSINVNKENFEGWMNRIMERFDKLDGKTDRNEKAGSQIDGELLFEFDKLEGETDGNEKVRSRINGELLFDNQDLCLILRVSRRTLQRYRTSGVLPYKQTDQKIYYLESDVRKFVEEHLQKPKVLDQRDKTL